MLELFRNCLGDLKQLKENNGNTICWKCITELAYLQKHEGLRAGNRLKLAKIRYWRSKMKVALAAQTLSQSVADALEYCEKDLKLKEFQGSEAIITFIRSIDCLFDFLNSQNPYGKVCNPN